MYCFEKRRYYVAVYQNGKLSKMNWTYIYGQTMTMIMFPLILLVLWKYTQSNKPILIKITTSLIPLIVIVALIITSGNLKYNSAYFYEYIFEIGAAFLFTISLSIIKYTQKTMYHTFQTIIYSDLMIAILFYFLKYMKSFVHIYYDDILHPNVNWIDILRNPIVILLGISYCISIY